MRERVLVTGGSGGLGRYVVPALAERGYDVIAPGHAEMDITSHVEVAHWFDRTRPAIAVHLVALADVPACAADPKRARLINAVATATVAHECGRLHSRMIYMSTDAVFSGYGIHRESDFPDPKSPYARTKGDGELFVTGLGNGGLVVRANFFTRYCNAKQSFAEYVTAGARVGRLTPCFRDVFATPVFAGSLAWQIAQAARDNLTGVLHVASSDSVNRVGQAWLILGAYGLPSAGVIDCDHPGGATDGRLIGRGMCGTVLAEAQKLAAVEPL
jgi:dTDP-4-dehydrorhamnose reductase